MFGDLSPPIRDQTVPPALGTWSLKHWAAREVPIWGGFLVVVLLTPLISVPVLSSQIGNEQVTAPGLQELQAGGQDRGVPSLSWHKVEQELCHLRGAEKGQFPQNCRAVLDWLEFLQTRSVEEGKGHSWKGEPRGQRPGDRKLYLGPLI